MKIIHEISTPEEKAEFFKSHPKSLFKYRDWINDLHKRILTQNEVFFSSPKRFNDPYDCGLPYNQHPDNSDPIAIKKKVEETAPRMFPKLEPNSPEMLFECARQVLLIQEDATGWFEMNWQFRPEEINKRYGVFSLTKHFDKQLMWAHYANSHNGFCVEFDTRTLIESIAGSYQKVKYVADLPRFSILDDLDTLSEKLIFTKSDEWEYEDEYRISKFYHPDTVAHFPPESLLGIYFGINMSVEQRIEIIDIARVRFPKVVFYNMVPNKVKYKFDRGECPLI